jgi:uncharacterized protein (UPF0216 family)
MPDELPYEKLLRESLKGELRVINAHLPIQQKTLAGLLAEDIPGIACKDGSAHLFKRKELTYLAGFLDEEERKSLLLPLLIEVNPGRDEIAVVCRGQGEEKVVSAVLDMPVTVKKNRITLYKPQLAVLRKQLRTTTQYLFSPGVLQ